MEVVENLGRLKGYKIKVSMQLKHADVMVGTDDKDVDAGDTEMMPAEPLTDTVQQQQQRWADDELSQQQREPPAITISLSQQVLSAFVLSLFGAFNVLL